MALKPIGLSHHCQGSNGVKEEITVRTQVTDYWSATLGFLFSVVVVKLMAFIPNMTKVLLALNYQEIMNKLGHQQKIYLIHN